VAFPYHDWRKGDIEGRRWRDAHLIDALAKLPDVQRILVVDRPVSLAERLIRRLRPWAAGRPTAERRHGRTRARITSVTEKIDVLDIHVPDLVSPVALNRGWWFRSFRDPRVLDQIRWATRETAMEQPTVFAWTPAVAPAVAAIDPGAVLFDSLDNWLIHPRLRRQAALAAEGYAALLPTATAVVASAPASQAVLNRWAARVWVIPNGVDPVAFARPTERPTDLPAGPIVGYAGVLSSRIDARLIAAVAQALPDLAFVFVGPVFERAAIQSIRRLPNVHLLGNRHYSLMPAYVQHFDLAWIPHAVGLGETGGDPIKMYEYWAAGREIVTTPIDGLAVWADRLHVVRSAREATRTITGLLAGTLDGKSAGVPPDRTWDAIATQMVRLVSSGPP
jgi:glycosyltransferase involved in cell wall biosynthesis